MKQGILMLVVGVMFLAVLSVAAQQVSAQEKVVMVAKPTLKPAPSSDLSAKLWISPKNKYLQLKPGEAKEFTVKVKNRGENEITLSPELEVLPFAEYFLEESWIELVPEKATLKAGEKVTFTVKISIPENADVGNYNSVLAFTNETYTRGSFPIKVNSLTMGVNIWKPPVVKILRKYVRDRVEAGGSYTYEIKLENTGDEAVSLSPKFGSTRMGRCLGMGCPTELEEAWVSINSPDKIEAGSKATVTIVVNMPAEAKGIYQGAVNLGINDPSIREWNQEVRLNLVVWQQPVEPYEKAFTVPEGSGKLSIEVGVNQHAYEKFGSINEGEPTFIVTLVSPEGSEISPSARKTVVTSVINLGAGYLPPWEEESSGMYRVERINYRETFILEDPAPGGWKLKVMPSNAAKFEYTIEVE